MASQFTPQLQGMLPKVIKEKTHKPVVVNLFRMRATLAPWRALAGRTNTTLDKLTLCLKITHFALSIQSYILVI